MPLTTSSKQGRISDSEQALLSSTSTLLNVSPGCFPKASPISVLGDSLLPQCHSSATGYLCPPVARSNFSDTTATRTVAIGPKEGSVKDDDEEMVQLAGSLSNTLGLLGDIQSAGGVCDIFEHTEPVSPSKTSNKVQEHRQKQRHHQVAERSHSRHHRHSHHYQHQHGHHHSRHHHHHHHHPRYIHQHQRDQHRDNIPSHSHRHTRDCSAQLDSESSMETLTTCASISSSQMQAPHDDTKESESIVGCLRQLRHRNDSRSSQESGTSGSVSTVSKYCFESRLQSASRSEPTEEDCLGVFNMHQDADATEALSDQPSPILVEWMRRRLYYFFMSPVEKFKTKRRLPYTLIIQLLKILIITIQVCTFLQHL